MIREDFSAYVCPSCRGPLDLQEQSESERQLCCAACRRSYSISGNIPDFLAPVMGQLDYPLIQRMDHVDRGRWMKWASGLYEGRFWYPFVISIYLGANTTSLVDLTRRIRAALNVEQGRVLDAACGSATFGRRVASAGREVFGMDMSMAMLKKGSELIQREGVENIHLARAQVEKLPFPDQFFDFAICSGPLHLFRDPRSALQEINRALKPGARLVGLTFTNGPAGLVRYAWFRERVRRRGTIHLFEVPELEEHLSWAGFERFQPQFMGSGVFFSVEKGPCAG